jgi:hypothetical protein
MIADKVPAADATVCTMLFSRMVESRNAESNAIEITAAGMEGRKRQPDFEAEIDIGRGEHDRDQNAQNEPAEGQFEQGLGGCRHWCGLSRNQHC